ncbi:MAG: glycosyltransferase family 2 protein [bacterium]
MDKQPKVSCIIPTYNRASCLSQAIDSVLAQDYEDLDLLVVDDGSTDHTSSILEGYGQRIHAFHQSHKGVSSARNLGLEKSKGEYIAYLDSDDVWLPRKISIQARFLDRNPDYPLCYTEEIWYRNGIRVNPGKRHRKYSGRIFTQCLPLCIISPSSAMMRKKILEEASGFDEDLPAAEDYALWLRITACHPVYLVPMPLIVKRGGHPDQLSRSVAHIDRYRIQALTKILTRGKPTSALWHQAWRELRAKCRIYGEGCHRHGRRDEAAFILGLPETILKRSGQQRDCSAAPPSQPDHTEGITQPADCPAMMVS